MFKRKEVNQQEKEIAVYRAYHEKGDISLAVTHDGGKDRRKKSCRKKNTENMIWHEQARKYTYFSLSNLLTLYKAQIRPSLEYCSYKT
nr:unnamed protein product [Callosobruchus chinensis]